MATSRHASAEMLLVAQKTMNSLPAHHFDVKITYGLLFVLGKKLTNIV